MDTNEIIVFGKSMYERKRTLEEDVTATERVLFEACNALKKLQAEIEKLKKRNTLSPFQKELALQCIKYVQNSPEGFRLIPLGYNLEKDIGLINLAIQTLKDSQ